MAYQVVVSFDLYGADREQYEYVKERLAEIGIYDFIDTDDERIELPYNTFTGDLDLSNADQALQEVMDELESILGDGGVRGKSFVAVGGTDFTSGVEDTK